MSTAQAQLDTPPALSGRSCGRKILLVGHACGPGLGSEPGNTWELARRLAAEHQVWLIAYPEFRDRVDAALAEVPIPNLHIEWVKPASWVDPWKPGKSERGIRLHYILWLRAAYCKARELHRAIGFDVLHHTSWATVGAAPSLWKVSTPALWGPLGGGQTTPESFLSYFGENRGKERMRTLYVKLRKYSPSLRRALRTADLVLATNPETEALLRQAGAKGARLFLDCGLLQEPAAENPHRANEGGRCTFLWAGRLESRKGLLLALEAMTKLRDLPVQLLVAGQGPERAAYEERVRQAGLSEKVQFLGPVPYADMPALFRLSDAFLFTSIRDSSGSVVLEAMSHALPILTLAHQGIGAFVPAEAGIKIPVKTPAQVIDDLAQAMRNVAECAAYRLQMGTAALERVRLEAWPKRVERLAGLYEEVISAHRRI